MAWAGNAWADDAWFGTAWAVNVSSSGGWGFMMKFEDFREKRDKEEEEREKVREEIEAIKDDTDREIAQILQKDLSLEAREKELKDLEILVSTTFQADNSELTSNVAKAFARAAVQKNHSAMEALERELDREREEDEFLMIAMMML